MNSTATIQNAVIERRGPALGPESFILSAGGIMLLGGAAKIISILEHTQMLDVIEPLSGFRFHYFMAFVGIAEILIAWLCLFTNKRTLALGMIVWLVICLLTYRVGAWTMGWHHPYPLLGSIMEALNISPMFADGMIATTSAYLLIGCAATFWRHNKATKAAKFQKIPCPSCGGRIQFTIQNLGRQVSCPHCQASVTLRKPENLKISCFFCREHIEFPAHALGRKIPCPHCKKDITLKEPA